MQRTPQIRTIEEERGNARSITTQKSRRRTLRIGLFLILTRAFHARELGNQNRRRGVSDGSGRGDPSSGGEFGDKFCQKEGVTNL